MFVNVTIIFLIFFVKFSLILNMERKCDADLFNERIYEYKNKLFKRINLIKITYLLIIYNMCEIYK